MNEHAHSEVWKFPLMEPIQMVNMPEGATILTVETQNDTPTLWALCDPNAEVRPRMFECYGTGHTIPDPDTLTYLGTAHGIDGFLVFHVFERVG